MKKTIALKINVSKIDKSRLFKGKKGTYLDAVLFYNEESDQYDNNGMIVQSVSKEERESGVKGEILGNAKLVSSQNSGNSQGGSPKMGSNVEIGGDFDNMDDDLPF